MLNSEFLVLLIANANKTRNVRCYTASIMPFFSDIPDAFATQIGRVIGLLQAKADEGIIGNKHELLLIDNFQAVMTGEQNKSHYYQLSLTKKPLADINDINDTSETGQISGIDCEIIINAKTGEVMNASQAALELGLLTEPDIETRKLAAPVSYGCYHDYPAPCCFIAMTNYKPIDDWQPVFKGLHNHSDLLQKAEGFLSMTEALEYLKDKPELGKYIGELIYPKEELPKLKATGLGKAIIKVIDSLKLAVVVTPLPETQQAEAALSHELKQIDKMLDENRPSFRQLMLASLENQYDTPEALAEMLTANQDEAKSLLKKSWQSETECLELKQALAQKQMEKKSHDTALDKNQRREEWLQELHQLQLQKTKQASKQEKPITSSQPNPEHKPDDEEGKQNTFGIMKLKL